MPLDTKKLKSVFGIKPRDWERELQRRIKDGTLPGPNDLSLAALGYPELYRAGFYLTDIGLNRWMRAHILQFPQICCVCEKPATVNLESSGLGVPHCDQHSAGPSQLLIEVEAFADKAVCVILTGRNEEFLRRTIEENREGDAFPPWEVFPQHDSVSGFWKQGGQAWMVQVFSPFWKALDDHQKSTYLQKWNAPENWRDRLKTE